MSCHVLSRRTDAETYVIEHQKKGWMDHVQMLT